MKLAHFNPVYKKKSRKAPTVTIGQLAYYPIFQKFGKDASMIKHISFPIFYCPNIKKGFIEATTHNTA